jgi:ABC-type oligopeptide transport system ATPase subunit
VSTQPLLEVRRLTREFRPRRGDTVRAVDNVSFSIGEGEAFGLVGESGSGKSTIARCVVRLLEPTSGEISLLGRDVLAASHEELQRLRRDMQIIFQDPYASLNPRMTVEALITEGMLVHRLADSRAKRRRRASELLELVGLGEEHLRRHPRSFSGGQRQRISIARALAVEPKLLVCDEPVSAVDVSVQAQILNLFKELQEQLGLTLLFIAHDLAVVRHLCNRIAVMSQGQIVETGTRKEIYDAPQHPYTRALLHAAPGPDPEREMERRRRRTEQTLSLATASENSRSNH